jgi:uncharacterized protein
MFSYDMWKLFEKNVFMSITMTIGSFIAGATSEGGGAVAFPVMTLIFKIKPEVARDFSLMIQSFGMTAAALTIFKRQISVVTKAIITSGIAAIIGNIIAFEYIVNLVSPAVLKIFFCSIWLSFVFVLLFVNKQKKILKKKDIKLNINSISLIFIAGLLGGIISGLTGSGLDILTFAMLTLYFRVCEKIATPTSVVLMAINSITCFALKQNYYGGMSGEAFKYLLVCLPIVVIGAPLGALFIKDKGQKFILNFLLISICIQYISALIIIKSTEPIYLISAITIFSGTAFFGALYYFGNRANNARPSSFQTPEENQSLGQTLDNLYQALGIKS